MSIDWWGTMVTPAILSPGALLTMSSGDAAVSFNDRLRAETRVSGGLTAAEAARRAETTSGEVAARASDVDADVDPFAEAGSRQLFLDGTERQAQELDHVV
jgi:hypothetical protein